MGLLCLEFYNNRIQIHPINRNLNGYVRKTDEILRDKTMKQNHLTTRTAPQFLREGRTREKIIRSSCTCANHSASTLAMSNLQNSLCLTFHTYSSCRVLSLLACPLNYPTSSKYPLMEYFFSDESVSFLLQTYRASGRWRQMASEKVWIINVTWVLTRKPFHSI